MRVGHLVKQHNHRFLFMNGDAHDVWQKYFGQLRRINTNALVDSTFRMSAFKSLFLKQNRLRAFNTQFLGFRNPFIRHVFSGVRAVNRLHLTGRVEHCSFASMRSEKRHAVFGNTCVLWLHVAFIAIDLALFSQNTAGTCSRLNTTFWRRRVFFIVLTRRAFRNLTVSVSERRRFFRISRIFWFFVHFDLTYSPFFGFFSISISRVTCGRKKIVSCKHNTRWKGAEVKTKATPNQTSKMPDGRVAEWLMAADCKSARVSVHRFKSCPFHHLPKEPPYGAFLVNGECGEVNEPVVHSKRSAGATEAKGRRKSCPFYPSPTTFSPIYSPRI